MSTDMNKNQIIDRALLKNVGGGNFPADICKAPICKTDACGRIGDGANFWQDRCSTDFCDYDFCRT